MQRIALCSMLLLAAHEASAAGVVRIANGDCVGLSKAASAPAGEEPSLIVLATKAHTFARRLYPVLARSMSTAPAPGLFAVRRLRKPPRRRT